MTRFYGLTREQQLREPMAAWTHYLNDIPFVAAWEQLRTLETAHPADAQKLAGKLQREIQEHLRRGKEEQRKQPRIVEQIIPLQQHPLLGKYVKMGKKKDA